MDSKGNEEILKESFKTLRLLKLWPNKNQNVRDGIELIKLAGVFLWLGFLFFGSILHFVHGFLGKFCYLVTVHFRLENVLNHKGRNVGSTTQFDAFFNF